MTARPDVADELALFNPCPWDAIEAYLSASLQKLRYYDKTPCGRAFRNTTRRIAYRMQEKVSAKCTNCGGEYIADKKNIESTRGSRRRRLCPKCRSTSRARTFTHNGETMTVADWARKVGIKPYTVNRRIRLGMSVHDAIFRGNEQQKQEDY